MKRDEASDVPLQPPLPGPYIEGHTIQCCARTRTIVLDGFLLRFSRMNYRLVERMLSAAGSKEPFVPIEELLQCFDHSQDHLRRSLYRHLSAIRQDLQVFKIDIASVRKQGYTLIWKSSEAEPP